MRKIYGFEPHAINPDHPRGGNQIFYRFANGYGVSLIPDYYDDVRELALLAVDDRSCERWEITSTSEVAALDPGGIARLAVNYIPKVLTEISELPARES
jgi:hypothetical protein